MPHTLRPHPLQSVMDDFYGSFSYDNRPSLEEALAVDPAAEAETRADYADDLDLWQTDCLNRIAHGMTALSAKPPPGVPDEVAAAIILRLKDAAPDALAGIFRDAARKYAYASTQFDLPAALADRMLAWTRSTVASADLRIPDDSWSGEAIEDEPHITVRYGLTEDDPETVARALVGFHIAEAQLGDTAVFASVETGKPWDVLIVKVESPDLRALNTALRQLPGVTTFPIYAPHVTLAYLNPGAGTQYAGRKDFVKETLRFATLTLSDRDGNKQLLPLGVQRAETLDAALLERDQALWVNPPAGRSLDDPIKPALGLTPNSVQTLTPPANGSGVAVDYARIFFIRHCHTAPDAPGGEGGDVITAWEDVPLDASGKQEATELGRDVFSLLDLSNVYCSDLTRAVETATLACEAADLPPPLPSDEWRPWDMGRLVGERLADVTDILAAYVTETPDEPIPGGESFNMFRGRLLQAVIGAMNTVPLAQPREANSWGGSIAVVTHSRCLELIKAWMTAGGPPTWEIVSDVFFERDTQPGSVLCLVRQYGEWSMEEVDCAALQPGGDGTDEQRADAAQKFVTINGRVVPIGAGDYHGVALRGKGPAHYQKESHPIRSLLKYQGQLHGQVNHHLRGTFSVAGAEEIAQEHVPHLDAAFGATKTAADTVLYRGIRREAHEWHDSPVENGIYRDKAYVSTTADPEMAAGFGSGNDHNVVRIHVPKGTPVVPMDYMHAPGEQPWHEKEVLLPRGQHFEAKGRDPETGHLVMHMKPYRAPEPYSEQRGVSPQMPPIRLADDNRFVWRPEHLEPVTDEDEPEALRGDPFVPVKRAETAQRWITTSDGRHIPLGGGPEFKPHQPKNTIPGFKPNWKQLPGHPISVSDQQKRGKVKLGDLAETITRLIPEHHRMLIHPEAPEGLKITLHDHMDNNQRNWGGGRYTNKLFAGRDSTGDYMALATQQHPDGVMNRPGDQEHTLAHEFGHRAQFVTGRDDDPEWNALADAYHASIKANPKRGADGFWYPYHKYEQDGEKSGRREYFADAYAHYATGNHAALKGTGFEPYMKKVFKP